MDEAEYLADRVAIIRRGEIVAEGPPRELVGGTAATLVRFRLLPGQESLIVGLDRVSRTDDLVAIETATPTALLHELTRRAHERDIELDELSVSRPTLEEVYLRLVGEEAPEAAE